MPNSMNNTYSLLGCQQLLLSIDMSMCAPVVKFISNSSCIFRYMIQHSTWHTPWSSPICRFLDKKFVSLHFGLNEMAPYSPKPADLLRIPFLVFHL